MTVAVAPAAFTLRIVDEMPGQFSDFYNSLDPDPLKRGKQFERFVKWFTIGIANGFPDLLTCDRPVYMSHGVMDERCFIALPLSPRLVFIATRSQSTFDRVMPRGIKAITKSINESMVTLAEKYVYGTHDRHLRFVENRLTKLIGDNDCSVNKK